MGEKIAEGAAGSSGSKLRVLGWDLGAPAGDWPVLVEGRRIGSSFMIERVVTDPEEVRRALLEWGGGIA